LTQRFDETALRHVRSQLEPARLCRVLGGRLVENIPDVAVRRRSAVATIIRDGAHGPEVLLMKRVERPGDSWSGQISLPGGMASQGDADLRATAVRETWEEVGIDLDVVAVSLGRLDDQVAIARGRRLSMAIAPFVFWVDDPPEVTLGPEADAAFWLPVVGVVTGAFDGHKEWSMAGISQRFPAWQTQGYTVWGLTHRMLSRLLEVAGL